MTLAVLLLGLGLALVVAEILFPSFGVLSLLATAAIVGSIVSAFGVSTAMGINFLVATAIGIPVAIVAGLKLFPRSPVGKHLVVGGLRHESRAATDERDLALVGRTGTVEAECRPAGIARIDGRRVDVVSRGSALVSGTPVRVVEVRGNRVVVVPTGELEHHEEPSS